MSNRFRGQMGWTWKKTSRGKKANERPIWQHPSYSPLCSPILQKRSFQETPTSFTRHLHALARNRQKYTQGPQNQEREKTRMKCNIQKWRELFLLFNSYRSRDESYCIFHVLFPCSFRNPAGSGKKPFEVTNERPSSCSILCATDVHTRNVNVLHEKGVFEAPKRKDEKN